MDYYQFKIELKSEYTGHVRYSAIVTQSKVNLDLQSNTVFKPEVEELIRRWNENQWVIPITAMQERGYRWVYTLLLKCKPKITKK